MPKKKNKIKTRNITTSTEAKIVFNEEPYSKIFSNSSELIKVLKKIDEWKSDEPLLKFKNNKGDNLIHAIVYLSKNAPNKLKLELLSYIPRLAKKEMDLNHQNKQSFSPIFLAISLQYEEAINSLCNAGADLTCRNIDGLNILDFALTTPRCSYRIYLVIFSYLRSKQITLKVGSFLIELAEYDNEKVSLSHIKRLQKLAQGWQLTIDIDSQHPLLKRTPLMAATRAKKLDILNYLMESKANLYIEDCEGFNVLSHAICIDDDNVLNAILTSADAKKLVNHIPSMDKSPLQMAVGKNPKFINLLLEKKADINTKNHAGFTALHTAISYNNEDIIQLIIDQPSLNILTLKPQQRRKYLSLAIEYSDVSVLEKLFKVPGLTPDSFSVNGISKIYALAMKLKKESHFKLMVERKLNFNFDFSHPFNFCCAYENTRLIKWFFQTQPDDVLHLDLVFGSLFEAIKNRKKKSVGLLYDLITDSFWKRKDWEFQFYYWRNPFASFCLTNNWVDLYIRFQPALKLFLKSYLFQGLSKTDLIETINYLQGLQIGGERYITKEMQFAYPNWPQTTDFSPILNRIPGMIDYIPDDKNPNQWIQFLYSSQPLTYLIYTPKALTPFSFFKEQGLSNRKIKEILRENKERKAMPGLSLLDSKQTKKNIPLPCTWFGGQISSSNLNHLRSIEGINIPNIFLLIPDSLKNIMPLSEPRRFNPYQGLKPLEGMPAVKVILKFNGNKNTIKYETKFTHEIKYVSTSDRILCVTVKPDEREQRGILILAVHYLPNGLHHHGTQSQLPTIVRVLMPTATSSTNQAGFN